MAQTFKVSQEPEPHRLRTRRILKEHPEVRNLIGKNPRTIWAIILIAGLQVGLSVLVQDAAWWQVFLVAYCIGAFADHALFVMIHECAHNLIFKRRSLNTYAAILANLPQILPSAVSFQRYHIKHHSFQGVPELDGDLPNNWEAKLINNSILGKVIWFLIYPIFQTLRLFRLKEIKPVDKWIVLNFTACVLFGSAVIYLLGMKSFGYLIASLFFSVGLHPLGARWIQEHYLVKEDQETYSYYGWWNILAFNVGYHNEHHDFPSVPWNKLPKLKSTALPWYDSLYSHRSWSKLFFRFLFDKKLSLYSRVIRKERGNVPLTDHSKPDLDLINQEAEINSQLT